MGAFSRNLSQAASADTAGPEAVSAIGGDTISTHAIRTVSGDTISTHAIRTVSGDTISTHAIRTVGGDTISTDTISAAFDYLRHNAMLSRLRRQGQSIGGKDGENEAGEDLLVHGQAPVRAGKWLRNPCYSHKIDKKAQINN